MPPVYLLTNSVNAAVHVKGIERRTRRVKLVVCVVYFPLSCAAASSVLLPTKNSHRKMPQPKVTSETSPPLEPASLLFLRPKIKIDVRRSFSGRMCS